MWISIIWTAVSGFFLIFLIATPINLRQEYNLLKNEGQITDAVITNLDTSDDGEGNTSYRVFYEFIPSGSTASYQIENFSSVSYSQYQSLERGQRIRIIYAPSDPKISVLENKLKAPSIFPFICGGGMLTLFIIIGIFLLRKSLKERKQKILLHKFGQITQGVIFECWTRREGTSSKSYMVAYAFEANHPDIGRTWITRAEYNTSAYNVLSEGDSVSIRYLPDDPEICQLVNYPR